MPDRTPNEERIKGELRRRPLTFAQRRRHLERLERAIAAGEEDNMEFLKRRSRTEFGMLAAAIALILFGYLFWTVVLSESDSDDETPDLVAQAGATLTAREQTAAAQAPSPEPTTPSTVQPPTATQGQASAEMCSADPVATDLTPTIPRGDLTHTDWYGSRETRLWVSPNNAVGLLPDGWPEASSLWFASGLTYLMWYGTPAPITVAGEQLDGDATLEPVGPADIFDQIQWTIFSFPEPGCWQITGSTDEESLTVTVEVLPYQQRPDVIYLEQLYAARPYEVPSTCATTDLVGPEERFDYHIAHYWLDSNGVDTSVFDWFVVGQQQQLGVHGFDVSEDLTATAHNLDSRSGEVIEAMTSIGNAGVRIVRYTFPSPGCWEMELSTPTTTATYVVYVYPEDCLPEYREGEFHVACEPPQS